jgi:8-oxo-dGTP pyrophosphatase MutT (NUDIX family)
MAKDSTKQARESVAGVAIESGNILLGLRRPGVGSMDGRWEIPGGKCETGENHCQALRREFLEELSVTIRCGELLARGSFENRGLLHDLFAYRVELTGPVGELNEHSKIAWYDREGLRVLIKTPGAMVESDFAIIIELLEKEGLFL